jgi:hypothetical protein
MNCGNEEGKLIGWRKTLVTLIHPNKQQKPPKGATNTDLASNCLKLEALMVDM